MLQPAYAPHQEVELIKAIIQNKVEPINHLYDLYAGALYGSILNSIKDIKKAKDILQAVFIKIYKGIRNYNPAKGRLFAWMLSIARNETLAVICSDKYLHSKAHADGISHICMFEINPNLHLNILDIRKFTSQLKPDQRVLIELYYYFGYNYHQIAGLSKVSLDRVMIKIKRARKELKTLLSIEYAGQNVVLLED